MSRLSVMTRMTGRESAMAILFTASGMGIREAMIR